MYRIHRKMILWLSFIFTKMIQDCNQCYKKQYKSNVWTFFKMHMKPKADILLRLLCKSNLTNFDTTIVNGNYQTRMWYSLRVLWSTPASRPIWLTLWIDVCRASESKCKIAVVAQWIRPQTLNREVPGSESAGSGSSTLGQGTLQDPHLLSRLSLETCGLKAVRRAGQGCLRS